MNIVEQMKQDLEEITGNADEFGVTLSFVSPTNETAQITGMYSDHSNSYDESGQNITGKFTHVTISEQFLINKNYPTRNTDGLADLNEHLVTVHYIDGSTKQYSVDDVRPDYTVNLFLLILSEYNGVD